MSSDPFATVVGTVRGRSADQDARALSTEADALLADPTELKAAWPRIRAAHEAAPAQPAVQALIDGVVELVGQTGIDRSPVNQKVLECMVYGTAYHESPWLVFIADNTDAHVLDLRPSTGQRRLAHTLCRHKATENLDRGDWNGAHRRCRECERCLTPLHRHLIAEPSDAHTRRDTVLAAADLADIRARLLEDGVAAAEQTAEAVAIARGIADAADLIAADPVPALVNLLVGDKRRGLVGCSATALMDDLARLPYRDVLSMNRPGAEPCHVAAFDRLKDLLERFCAGARPATKAA